MTVTTVRMLHAQFTSPSLNSDICTSTRKIMYDYWLLSASHDQMVNFISDLNFHPPKSWLFL